MLKNELSNNTNSETIIPFSNLDLLEDKSFSIPENFIKENTIQNSNIENNQRNESSLDSISEKLSSIGRSIKKEKIGILYCLLAQFLWTSNSIYLKFLTQYWGEKFKNKSFLFARGFMTVIISYFLGIYEEGKIYKLSELPQKIFKVLMIRVNFNFFSMSIWVVSVCYLRISTCQILSTLSPIIIIFCSVILLGEKCYKRYAIGVILGIIGSSIIIFNENKVPTIEKKDSKNYEIFIGVFCSVISMLSGGIESVCNKVMANNKTPITTQLFYTGCAHCMYSILWMIISKDFDFSFLYLIMCMMHAILFFSGFYTFNKGLEIIDLSKSSLIQYSKIVFVLVLSAILLGQPIFFSDILGSVIIVSFMIYHLMNPIR